jgi:hypothetical protein
MTAITEPVSMAEKSTGEELWVAGFRLLQGVQLTGYLA